MKHKEKELLLLLYDNSSSYQTGCWYAKQLHVSERTIRTYIRTLEHYLKDKGGRIQAKQGSGYRLIVQDGIVFDSMISKLKSRSIVSVSTGLESVQDRQTYILSKLLLEDEHIILDQLCETLYVSRSTLSKDLSTIKDLLQPYHLSLQSKTNYGTWIYGNETDKRALIIDYFFRESQFASLQEYLDHSGYFDDVPVETVLMVILDENRKSNLKLSDFKVQNILLHIGLSIKRIRKGLYLDQTDSFSEIPDAIEFRTAQNILNRLEDSLSMKFPPEEVRYLTLHLGVRGQGSFSMKSSDRLALEKEIQDVLLEIDMETGCSLAEDGKLCGALLEHCIPMLIRLKKGIIQKNPLTCEIMSDHSNVYRMTRQAFSKMPSFRGYDISSDEWAYLAIHIMSALVSASEKQKIQVLVIYTTGIGSSQLLKNRLEKEFGDSIHIVSETGYFDMNNDILKGIDLIISSVNLGPVIFGVPFIHVSLFLNDEDMEMIRSFIQKHNSQTPGVSAGSSLAEERRRELLDLSFHPKHFRAFHHNQSKEEIL